jgi:SAM-dependent methyltransferase
LLLDYVSPSNKIVIRMSEVYHPKPYWSDVAKRIGSRGGHNVIAGDDEPYYRYKRNKFLQLLSTLDIEGKNVAEIGSGPGGNLVFVHAFRPKTLTGIDISADMIALAKTHVPADIQFINTSGESIPLDPQHFDLTFTATVLQHNTDDAMWRRVIADICRVTKDEVHVFEKVTDKISGDDLCMGRPVDYYAEIFAQHGFEKVKHQYLHIKLGYLVCGAIRKGLNPKSRQEGEPLNGISVFLQKALLPITNVLDGILKLNSDLCHIHFKRTK